MRLGGWHEALAVALADLWLAPPAPGLLSLWAAEMVKDVLFFAVLIMAAVLGWWPVTMILALIWLAGLALMVTREERASKRRIRARFDELLREQREGRLR